MGKALATQSSLNAVCPYFTMFPLHFPRQILASRAKAGDRVLDPFCGRGTTNFAARLGGLQSVGIDSSPVAVAITAGKLATSNVEAVVRVARRILATEGAVPIPEGEFWSLAFCPEVLHQLSKLRRDLIENCRSDARKVLRAIILGALHGPLGKKTQSYFSNQCPRTYSPKPAYAVKYWRANSLRAPSVDVLGVIRSRAERFLAPPLPAGTGVSKLGDSRKFQTILSIASGGAYDWIITSPPYYGMRTYVQDQWLRNWFVGGADSVDYAINEQLGHLSPEVFSFDLSQVWANVSAVCNENAKLVVRFGGIRDRDVDPLELIKTSLQGSPWRISTVHDAGSADSGKRQANEFLTNRSKPIAEYDVWAKLD